jgi:hypothetical protein
MGNALAQHRQFGDAEKAFLLSLRLEPKDLLGNNRGLAILCSATGRLESAAKYARIALEWMDREESERRIWPPELLKAAADRFPNATAIEDELRRLLLDILKSSGQMPHDDNRDRR